jgi:hypothetical protein
MSSEPRPQPVSDTFNQSQWNIVSTGTDRAWVTLNFLSKVVANTAAAIITFTLGIKTNSLETITSGGTANVYVNASIVDINNNGLTRIGNGASNVTLGSATNTAVNIYKPKSLTAILSPEDNSTNIPSTSWVQSFWTNIKDNVSTTFYYLQTFTSGIETLLINPLTGSTNFNICSVDGTTQDVNILNGNYGLGTPRGNLKLCSGENTDTDPTKNNIEILSGNGYTNYGNLVVGNPLTQASLEGRLYINSIVQSINDIDILNADYTTPLVMGDLNIMCGTVDAGCTQGKVRIQSGTSNGGTTIGNSLSSLDFRAGLITFYYPISPSYSYPIGAGKIGEVKSGTYTPFPVFSTFTSGTAIIYSTITLTAEGVYQFFFQGSFTATGTTVVSLMRFIIVTTTGGKFGQISNNLGGPLSATGDYTNSCCSTVYHSGTSKTYQALVTMDFTGGSPSTTPNAFYFNATRIA